MNEVTRILTGLEATRPRLEVGDLLLLDEPNATFEVHVPAETGEDFWIYTVNGSTLDGDCIVVRASTPNKAETVAQEGLRASISALKTYDNNTGLQAEVEVRGLQ
jgi:hypothetical protein